MQEFYVWTKRNPFYRGPYELSDAIAIAKESAYVSEDQRKAMLQDYVDGTRFDWHLTYGFNDLAHITVNRP